MSKFEYTITYLPLPNMSTGGVIVNKKFEPDIDKFFGTTEGVVHLDEMGAKGWELVSSQGVLGASAGSDVSVSFNDGFMLFWKRIVEA